MAIITGHDGSVTFASGFATSVKAWAMRVAAGIIDTTPFEPTSDYSTASAGIQRWDGSYTCVHPATVASTVAASSGTPYLYNPYRYNVELTCNPLDATAFTAAAASHVAGLLSARGSVDCYIDDTSPMLAAGQSATILFTLSTGVTYSIPAIVESVNYDVSADGSARTATLSVVNSGAVTAAGSPPVPGVTGAATFTADTGRELAGTILVTSVRVTKSASREDGEIVIGFVGSGAVTPT